MKSKVMCELASCHNGDLEMLKALVRSAAENGADVAKVQDWKSKNISESDPDKARYEKYQFKDEWWPEFIETCADAGIEPLTSCFNAERAETLSKLGLKKIKLASVCLTNRELLMRAGLHFEEVILSTGMATLEEIEEAADILASNSKKFTLLACTANYPMEPDQAGLERMTTLRKLLAGQHYASVGYSSHALDLDVPKAALVYAPEYLEVHFSLSRSLPQIPHQMYSGGPKVTTHQVALEPKELKELTAWRDKVSVMLGDGQFRPNEVESKIRERYLGRYGV